MPSLDLDGAVSDSFGRNVTGTNANEDQYVDPDNFNYSVALKQLDTDEVPTYVYSSAIRVNTLRFDKYTASASCSFSDQALTQIIDYEGQHGINLNSHVKGRHLMLVLDESETDSEELPEMGTDYANDKVVLFSGYNRTTYGVSLNGLEVVPTYVGIEELLNEIKIKGIYQYDVSQNGRKFDPSNLSHCLNPCVFNKDGHPNMSPRLIHSSLGFGRYDEQIYLFDTSYLVKAKNWSLKDILKYILSVYLFEEQYSSMIDTSERFLNNQSLISKFIKFDLSNLDQTDLGEIYPKDFSLEGLGVYEAIIKILNESRRNTLSKMYDVKGRVRLGFDENNVSLRKVGKLGMTIKIGDVEAPASKDYNAEGFEINLNREHKNVGRVIVLGDNLRINTLLTTVSSTLNHPITNGTPSGVLSFLDNLGLHLSNDFSYEFNLTKHVYVAISTPWKNRTLGDLGFTIADFNETSDLDTKLFNSDKAVKFERRLYVSDNAQILDNTKDAIVYVPNPSEERDGVVHSSDWSVTFPTQKDGENLYYQLGAAEKNDILTGGYIEDEYGAIFLQEKDGELGDDSGLTKFEEYMNEADMNLTEDKYFGNSDFKTVPIFARCAVVADYRIKGIAQLDDFDPDVHETIYVDDRGFTLNITYLDALFKEDHFEAIPDGFLDSTSAMETLQAIQKKAEAVLLKYTTVQNSGMVPLAGIQRAFKVGDHINEIEGGSRTIPMTTVISGLIYDFPNRQTIISLGADHS